MSGLLSAARSWSLAWSLGLPLGTGLIQPPPLLLLGALQFGANGFAGVRPGSGSTPRLEIHDVAAIGPVVAAGVGPAAILPLSRPQLLVASVEDGPAILRLVLPLHGIAVLLGRILRQVHPLHRAGFLGRAARRFLVLPPRLLRRRFRSARRCLAAGFLCGRLARRFEYGAGDIRWLTRRRRRFAAGIRRPALRRRR